MLDFTHYVLHSDHEFLAVWQEPGGVVG